MPVKNTASLSDFGLLYSFSGHACATYFFFFSNLAIHNWQGYTIYIYNASIVLQQYQIFSNFNFLNDYQRRNESEHWINMRPTPVRDPSWLK